MSRYNLNNYWPFILKFRYVEYKIKIIHFIKFKEKKLFKMFILLD